ncbi:MAG: sn-glycerol-1-phosphate dehydrogenase [Clostridia bacterium]|nr:sn-glycerol-1-phosphate dehydrogenase [Clostridia bacterium]
MPDFRNMTLPEMVRHEGFTCTCGREHICPLDYLNVGRGILHELPDMLKAMGTKYPFVICDDNTYAAAGKLVCEILEAASIPHQLYIIPCQTDRLKPAEWEVGSVIMHYDPACDLILGVGSGVVNDICKVVAHAVGRKNAIVGTAPSMDGYASNSSSMEMNHVKVSLYNQAPSGILLDVDILAQAPMRMLWAGLGDMIAKYIALCEWRISHLVIDEYYCQDIADLMREGLNRVINAADGLAARDPQAVQAVAEGLVIGGIAMAYAKISRPASGLEHYFSHMWEMMALERGEPYDLHGIQVGIGSLLTLNMYRDIRKIVPDADKARDYWRRMTPERWESQIRAIFGKTAPEILALEAKEQKNDPAKHEERLSRIIGNWDRILKIIDEEIPAYDQIYQVMSRTGMPLIPRDIGISDDDTVNAFIGARDARNKYMTCTLLWDLGLTEEYAGKLREFIS